jgi:hypothetical protein
MSNVAEWLREELKRGPVMAYEITRLGRAAGFSTAEISLAADKIADPYFRGRNLYWRLTPTPTRIELGVE